ncbi:hypothetical protein BC826DRAFT_969714 [Russula brevipes]|nr:hypothetical protein BC826DRAFT_969714 [Russula brevipes]
MALSSHKLAFQGMSKYSETLVAHIDTPMLNRLDMTFLPSPILDVRHLKEFIGRAKGSSHPRQPSYGFPHSPSTSTWKSHVVHQWESSATRLIGRLPPESPPGNGVMVSTQFLEIFRLVTATRSLYVPESIGQIIASVLQELIGERATEVLPNLRDIFLERSARSGSIQQQPIIWRNGRKSVGDLLVPSVFPPTDCAEERQSSPLLDNTSLSSSIAPSHTNGLSRSPVTADIVAQATLSSATSTDDPSKGLEMGELEEGLRSHQKESSEPRSLCQATIDMPSNSESAPIVSSERKRKARRAPNRPSKRQRARALSTHKDVPERCGADQATIDKPTSSAPITGTSSEHKPKARRANRPSSKRRAARALRAHKDVPEQ